MTSLALANPIHVAINCLSMAGGGAELAVARLSNGLAARGYKVDLVLWRKTGPLLAKIDPAVTQYELGGPRIAIGLRLAQYLRSHKPDVVLSHQTFLNVMTTAALLLSRLNAPQIGTEHNAYSRAVKTKRSWIGWVYRVAPIFYRRLSLLAVVSAGVGDDAVKALRVPREKIRVVYNPAVSDRLIHLANADAPLAWLSDDGPPVFLSVGRLVPQKNPEMLIRAFAKVRAHRPCRLVLLGEGLLEAPLRQLVSELGIGADVCFAGFVANPYPCMKHAHALVLASDFEGFAIVVAEAIALGTRVISTDCEYGPAEILDNGAIGTLVPIGDELKMADAMTSSLEDVDGGAMSKLRIARADLYTESRYIGYYEGMLKDLGILTA